MSSEESTAWHRSDAEQSLLGNEEQEEQLASPVYKLKHVLIAFTVLLITICASSIVTLVCVAQLKGISNQVTADGLMTGKTWQTLHTYTDFSSPDQIISEKAWDQFAINGFVALPNAWAKDRGWPVGREMPGDEEKGIYVVDGFHQLHCLISIRTMVNEMLDGNPVDNITHTERHPNHCYDALRQSIMCRADSRPLYVPKNTFFAGDGQKRQCGSWSELQDWVVAHTICYNGVSC